MFDDTSRQIFNDGWLFLPPGPDEYSVNPAAIPAKCQNVDLPHSWNSSGWTYEYSESNVPAGTGWYFKNLPAVKNTSIKFEGIAAEAEIFLNGIKIAENLGAYRVFEVSLDNAKGDGNDLLAIKVTDKASASLLLPKGDPFSQSPRYKLWKFPLGSSMKAGGIWRNVWLYSNNGPRVFTPVVESSSAALKIHAEVSAPTDKTSICYNLYAPDGKFVVGKEVYWDKTVELCPDVVKLWWPLAPELYRLETTLLENGIRRQTIIQSVAFFEICIRDSSFFINGKPYFLRGQNGFPHCNIPHDAQYIRRYVSRICEQGVEISRFHTEPPAHAWLDECDRQGILVIFEMALHGSMGCYPIGHPDFQRTYIEELRSLVKEYRRHPSIAMWCLGNEIIVDSERSLGLGEKLFDILDEWVGEVRKLDCRPIIANSGGDAAELVKKTVADIDDVHQYGGWYTENLYDLHNYEKYARKNDMLFQPTICTESVAAYTDNHGQFFANHGDSRQRKVIRQRCGDPDKITPAMAMHLQAFILKEYAEAMWRFRREDTTLGGYIPFGQYTWFFDPFTNGPTGLRDKPIWDVYRKVMSPVHVQLECWNRHVFHGNCVTGKVILNHEDRKLPKDTTFTIVITAQQKELYRRTVNVKYHSNFCENTELDVRFLAPGTHKLVMDVFTNQNLIATNDREIKIYPHSNILTTKPIWIYDPTGKLDALNLENASTTRISDLSKMNFLSASGIFIIGPFAMDKEVRHYTAAIRNWCKDGNMCFVMEQLPDTYTQNMLQTGISIKRSTQPYWSRWAQNMVRHADRADISIPSHPVFLNLEQADISWWNGDTFLADAYLRIESNVCGITVLSGISHGLSDDELMPVEHSLNEQDYNPLMLEYLCGKGMIIFSNLLIGKKVLTEPVAEKLLANVLSYMDANMKSSPADIFNTKLKRDPHDLNMRIAEMQVGK